MSRRLVSAEYLSFPFRVSEEGSSKSVRESHVREQIEQVLYTDPQERVFRPEFGAGIRRLVFEPNNATLWSLTRRRISASLAEALYGEVDPESIEVRIDAQQEYLIVNISYMLAAIGRQENQLFKVNTGGMSG